MGAQRSRVAGKASWRRDTSKLRLERWGSIKPPKRGKTVPGTGNSMCEGPEAGVHLVYVRN